MTPSPTPANESARLAALHGLDILDTSPDERFDRLTRMARRMFDVPIASVNFVDAKRHWSKSCLGLPSTEAPREVSLCGHAILSDAILLVPDTAKDERFADNPVVTGEPHIRFYAGYPLSVGDGLRVGTLCIMDTKPRHFSREDAQLLLDLGKMAEQELRAVSLATSDELTGLSNRRGFMAAGKQVLEVCRRSGKAVTLLYFDLDRFKFINDRFGHAEGDFALKAFGNILKSVFRSSDVVARLGGDEFVVMLSNSDEAQTQMALRRFEDELATHNREAKRGYVLAYSVGNAVLEGKTLPDLDTLLALADDKMYRMKKVRHATTEPGT